MTLRRASILVTKISQNFVKMLPVLNVTCSELTELTSMVIFRATYRGPFAICGLVPPYNSRDYLVYVFLIAYATLFLPFDVKGINGQSHKPALPKTKMHSRTGIWACCCHRDRTSFHKLRVIGNWTARTHRQCPMFICLCRKTP